MKRVVVVCAALVLVACVVGPAACMNNFVPAPCPPSSYYVTKMVPCVKTQMVASVRPVSICVPVQKVGYRCQKFLVKGTPVGAACGSSPCVQCCPQPFCQVVERKVPYVYFDKKQVTYNQVCYQPIQKTVWLPQKYRVCETPMCGR